MKISHYLAVNLMTLLLFATQYMVRYAQGLNCFQCTGDASPLCDEKHTGHSVICPDHNDTFDACWIMRVYTEAIKRYEIYKGCSRNFPKILNEDNNWTNLQDNCYSKVIDPPGLIQTYWQTIEYCFCDSEDDCNKETIEGVGREDIEQREKAEQASDGNILQIRLITMLALNIVAISRRSGSLLTRY